MRNSKSPATMGELMGEGFEGRTKLSLEDLPKILGEKMPSLSYDRVGKIRLINALHMRFGVNYSHIPGVQNILEHFEKEMHTAAVVKMNRMKRQMEPR